MTINNSLASQLDQSDLLKKSLRLSSIQVFQCLCNRVNHDRTVQTQQADCFVYRDTIAKKSGLNPKTVSFACKQLKEMNLIKMIYKVGHATTFIINLDELNKYVNNAKFIAYQFKTAISETVEQVKEVTTKTISETGKKARELLNKIENERKNNQKNIVIEKEKDPLFSAIKSIYPYDQVTALHIKKFDELKNNHDYDLLNKATLSLKKSGSATNLLHFLNKIPFQIQEIIKAEIEQQKIAEENYNSGAYVFDDLYNQAFKLYFYRRKEDFKAIEIKNTITQLSSSNIRHLQQKEAYFLFKDTYIKECQKLGIEPQIKLKKPQNKKLEQPQISSYADVKGGNPSNILNSENEVKTYHEVSKEDAKKYIMSFKELCKQASEKAKK